MDKTYLDELTSVLQKDERLVNEDGRLLKTKITEYAHNLDPSLMELIVSNEKLKNFFFKKIKDVLIFDQDKFLTFVHNEAFLKDSFTAFKNKIGLATSRDDYIAERSEVVLNWPYKDCVLEGGQDKEDQKRDEVFWNETLGADQQDTLLAPKVFDGFKKYDKTGEHKVTELSEKDNLILRGNNLLALHSLKKRYSGKVNLIYIDPPFNTGGDSFNYNDRFTHSTWLTFMKNRLSVARDLLTEDGLIMIHIDQDEGHYLKVLADGIFGRDNFRNELVWAYRTGGASKKTSLPKKHDIILTYAKSPASGFNGLHERQYLEKSFMGSKVDKDGRFYVDTILRDIFEGVIISPQGTALKEYNVRPVLNLSSERVEDFQSQKPEGLIQLLLDIATKPGDLVMDFHVGSGTTAAAAHKMGRQYIGLEQLEYGEKDALVRLQEVINGDQTGISKNVGWKEGGSFVYAYLKNDVNVFIKQVEKAKNSQEAVKLLDVALSSNFLSFRVDPHKFEKVVFAKLPLNQQKTLLIELVNKNKLYVNYHDIDDVAYGVDPDTKKVNKWLQSRG